MYAKRKDPTMTETERPAEPAVEPAPDLEPAAEPAPDAEPQPGETEPAAEPDEDDGDG